jgi:hypothetical protein
VDGEARSDDDQGYFDHWQSKWLDWERSWLFHRVMHPVQVCHSASVAHMQLPVVLE